MLADVTQPFSSASEIARFTECAIPKSSAVTTSNVTPPSPAAYGEMVAAGYGNRSCAGNNRRQLVRIAGEIVTRARDDERLD